MFGVAKGAIAKRMSGDKPSPLYAAAAAVVVGATVAVLTYRVIRG
jgi:hypothetical protein